MSFGEVYTAERSIERSVSSLVSKPSRAFSEIEDSGDSSIRDSQLGKALSAHFNLYPDTVVKAEGA